MNVGREKVKRAHLSDKISFAREDCTSLSFADESFDAVTVAFGIRNFEACSSLYKKRSRFQICGGTVANFGCSSSQQSSKNPTNKLEYTSNPVEDTAVDELPIWRKYMDNQTLLLRYKETGDMELKWALVLRYTDLVRRIAIQTCGLFSGFTQLDDVIHEGILVLLSAVDKYDPEKEVKFEASTDNTGCFLVKVHAHKTA